MRTVGVEEELLLVDRESGQPRSVSALVLRIAEEQEAGLESGERAGGTIDHELQQEQIETDTHPHTEMAEIQTELQGWRDRANEMASETGTQVVASGTSPLAVEPSVFRDARFEKMAERFGITTSEQLTCGCHVHVSVESEEEAVAVLDRVRVWLPPLLALSANSPFWQGTDTGYASYRCQAVRRWPASGPTDVFGSAADYRKHVEEMLAADVLLDRGMLYADARPSHQYPTLEFRVADVCLDVRDAVLIAALCRGLVITCAEEWKADVPPASTSTSVLRLATWQAGKDGIGGRLVDPRTSRPRPARDVIKDLVQHVAPALRSSGDESSVQDGIADVFRRGNGATRQRRTFEETGRLTDVVSDLARVTAGHES